VGFLKKIFGGGSAADHLAKGDDLFERRDFGGAKLAYDKALERSKDEAERERIAEKRDAALDGLARGRVAEAKRLVSSGEPEMARDELEQAMELVAGEEARREVQAAIDRLERADALDRAQAEEEEMTDEERLTLISGRWEEAQAEEYDEYDERFFRALLLREDGELEESHALLEAVFEEAEAPRYLWFEVAFARLGIEDDEGAKEAFEELLASLADDEVGEVRLSAYVNLARLANLEGDFEGAMAQYQAAIEAFESDYRPYFVMGVFLRSEELPEEAIEVLSTAAAVMDDMRPDWSVMQELGLAHRDAGNDEQAIHWLERVVSFMTDRKLTTFPTTTAVPLAELHEAAGNLERAADLYATLTKGRDVARHAHYHAEAGRLLAELGLTKEARRMLKRAVALASPEDDDATPSEDVESSGAAPAGDSRDPSGGDDDVDDADDDDADRDDADDADGDADDDDDADDADRDADGDDDDADGDDDADDADGDADGDDDADDADADGDDDDHADDDDDADDDEEEDPALDLPAVRARAQALLDEL